MEEIKIYSHYCSNGKKIILLKKDKNIFLRIYEEINEISYITSSNEKYISYLCTDDKKINLYEFMLSKQLNDLILKPKKEVKYHGDNAKNKLEEVKEYFENLI